MSKYNNVKETNSNDMKSIKKMISKKDIEFEENFYI